MGQALGQTYAPYSFHRSLQRGRWSVRPGEMFSRLDPFCFTNGHKVGYEPLAENLDTHRAILHAPPSPPRYVVVDTPIEGNGEGALAEVVESL